MMASVAHCRVHHFGLDQGITDGATRRGDDVVLVDAATVTSVLPVGDIPCLLYTSSFTHSA